MKYRVWTTMSEAPFIEDALWSNRDPGHDELPDGMLAGESGRAYSVYSCILMVEPFEEETTTRSETVEQ
jgi:hypothetical protein